MRTSYREHYCRLGMIICNLSQKHVGKCDSAINAATDIIKYDKIDNPQDIAVK